MRDYQRQKNNPYILPKTAYKRAIDLVKDYDRIRREIAEIPYETHTGDGQPRGSTPGDPTGEAAVRMERKWQDCKAVDDALYQVPQEYRTGVFNNVLYPECGYPVDAGIATYSRKKSLFLYHVAKNAYII